MAKRPLCVAALACGALLTPTMASAQRAPYATVDELTPEPIGLLLDTSMAGRYQRVLDAGSAGNPKNIGDFMLRSRFLAGSRLAYVAGVDAALGGADAGLAYAASAQLAGVGVRFGEASGVALSGGVGVSAIGKAVPAAPLSPVELRWMQSAGPLRFALWAQGAWVLSNSERRGGSPTVGLVDEAEVGVSVRVGGQQRYWGSHSGGGGPSLGVLYRETMGARVIGFTLGFDLAGAR